MTRKDYELLAAALKASAPAGSDERFSYVDGWVQDRALQWHAVVSSVADALAGDNPNFNRRLFKLACGTAPKLAG